MTDVRASELGTIEVREREVREENVRCVRLGHGANCSSVGSVIDTIFLGATLGGAVLAAVFAAMKVESITVVGAGAPPPSRSPSPSPSPSPPPPPPPPSPSSTHDDVVVAEHEAKPPEDGPP